MTQRLRHTWQHGVVMKTSTGAKRDARELISTARRDDRHRISADHLPSLWQWNINGLWTLEECKRTHTAKGVEKSLFIEDFFLLKKKHFITNKKYERYFCLIFPFVFSMFHCLKLKIIAQFFIYALKQQCFEVILL